MSEVKKRVLWVDIAKAIAIISVIISHTVENPSDIRALLFSFHLPLFFILSGYTTRLATSKADFFRRFKKNFIHILLPAAIFSVICVFLQSIIDGNPSSFLSNYNIWLFSRTEYYFGLGAMLWFLLSLFSAKVLMDAIKTVFKTERSELINVLLGLFGLFLGLRGIRLPLYLDLTFIAMLLIEVGIFWKRHEETVKKYHYVILISSLVVWFNFISKGSAPELMIRIYPGGISSLIESIAATYVVCEISRIIEDCIDKGHGLVKKIGYYLTVLGANTLILYLIHSLDAVLLDVAWDRRDGSGKMYLLSVFLRLLLDILVFISVYCIFQAIRSRQKQKNIV